MRLGSLITIAFAAAIGLPLVGCGQSASPPHAGVETSVQGDAHDHDAGKTADHNHSGWWCDEHGVPEEVCAQCNSKVAADFQKKGDWCKEHDRPDSQCFICHPELEAKFAAQYEAKYGKKPPAPDKG